jgi:acyl-CoA synthetase (AMP-forming)/AMP-acid ligase II
MNFSPANNVIRFLEANAVRSPQQVALRWVIPDSLAQWNGKLSTPLTYGEITYAGLVGRVRAAACGMQARGISQGDRVLVFLPMGLAMYTAMFAVQRLGCIAVFLDSWARRHHLRETIACVQPRAMISETAAFDLITGIPEGAAIPVRIAAGPDLEELCCTPGEAKMAAVEEEFPALITFTTGSSGVPKGANRTHRFLAAQHQALDGIIPYRTNDRDLPAFPIFSLNNLASGVTTILPAINLAQPSDQDGALLTHQLLHEGITCATLSISMLNQISRFCHQQGVRLDSLRRGVTGGAPVSREELRAFGGIAPHAELLVLYGSTEVEPIAHITAREMLAESADLVHEGVNVGRISSALQHKFIRITKGPVVFPTSGWSALEVANHAVGELVVHGDHVCRDYYNNPDAFRRAKIVDERGQVWHRTGDLGRLDQHGNLWLAGRVHNAILRGGSYCFPVQSEVLLKSFPFVRQGAYLGLPDTQLGERAAAVVVLDPTSGIKPDEVLARIRTAFAAQGRPLDSFYVVEQIPMDARHHSKVEYGALRDVLRTTQARDWLA